MTNVTYPNTTNMTDKVFLFDELNGEIYQGEDFIATMNDTKRGTYIRVYKEVMKGAYEVMEATNHIKETLHNYLNLSKVRTHRVKR